MRYITIIIIFFCLNVNAQDWKQSFKESWKPATPMFIAGTLNGVVEVLRHDPGAFKRQFPKVSMQFWNPAVSWENKWLKDNEGHLIRPLEEKFLGSSTLFVASTDGYHMLRLMENTSYLVAINISLNSNKKDFKCRLIKTAISTIAWSIGFNLSYEFLRRKR